MLGHSLRMRASVRLPPTHSWPAGRLRRCACVLGWPAGCKAERRADIFLVPAPLVPDLPRTGPELSLAWWVRAIGQGLREPASEVRRPRRTAEWALASASPARCRARLRRPAEGRRDGFGEPVRRLVTGARPFSRTAGRETGKLSLGGPRSNPQAPGGRGKGLEPGGALRA